MTPGLRIALGSLIAVGPVAAQDSSGTSAPQPAPRSCFRGGPLPTCHSFWITEAAYLARVTTGGDPYSTHHDRFSASLEVGGMGNVSPKVALGASASANLVDGVAIGIRSRIRYWLTPTSSLDFAPGLLVGGVPGPPRFTADVSLMSKDRVGITVQSFGLPWFRYQSDGTYQTGNRLVVYAGLKLGSKLGLYGAAADAVAILALFGTFLAICSNGNCD